MEDTKKRLEAILDAKEISEIQMFLERPILVQAVKKVLFQPILSEGTMKPGEAFDPGRNFLLGLVGTSLAEQGMISDEALGQDLKARWKGIVLIESTFKDFEALKVEKVVERKEVNKAI